ncbi:hypothetical protein [Streptomyces acidiscabies]|uniref:hypothetical protein n=1 Tax=Streptomyces acidiscabies TaxID=42234 RepID=UPI000950D7D1|nr:hypothetical protein [Streptomyces acidiscabies]
MVNVHVLLKESSKVASAPVDAVINPPAGTNLVRDRDGVSVGNRCESADSVANEAQYLNEPAKKHEPLVSPPWT